MPGAARGRAQPDGYGRRGKRVDPFYKSAEWKRIREAQINSEPLCRLCAKDDRVSSATVCDHVEPHRGNEDKKRNGPFQSLCASCHARQKQREEQASLATRGVWD